MSQKKRTIKEIIILPLAGISIGWLIGMTEQGIIVSVITALLTLLITIVAYLSGIKQGTEHTIFFREVDIKPASILIIFITFGVASGIWTRTHNYLSDIRIGKHGWTETEIKNVEKIYGLVDSGSTIRENLLKLEFSDDMKPTNTGPKGFAYSGTGYTNCKSICEDWSRYQEYIKKAYTKEYDENLIIEYQNEICKCD